MALSANTSVLLDAGPAPQADFMCVLPWINLHVATTGAITPCCEFGGEIANLSATTLEAAWKSPKLENIRRAFLQGTPLRACRKCIDREASEGNSIRKQANVRFAEKLHQIAESANRLRSLSEFPTSLDLRFSNLCNFKCRSCWHGASSKWFSDGKAIGLTVGDKAEISSFSTVDNFMEQIEPGLSQIEYIYFAGGEPLLQPEQYALLQKFIELGRTDLALAYNSNMSVMSSKTLSIFDLWSHFPSVEVVASVDASGDLGALIRKGFDWTTFVTNIGALRDRCPHVRIRFGITVSIMNIIALPSLFIALEQECGATAADFDLHSLQDPIYYRSQVLPSQLKAQAETQLREFMASMKTGGIKAEENIEEFHRKIRGLIDYMNARDLSDQLPRCAKVTAQLDALRDDTGVKMFPGIQSHISQTGRS